MAGGVFIIAQTAQTAAELVGYAMDWGKTATVVALSADTAAFAETGADAVVGISGDDTVPENCTSAIAAYLKEQVPEIVLAGNDIVEQTVASGVAGYLGCAMVTDAQTLEAIDGALVCEHSAYGGMVVRTEEMPFPCVASVVLGKREPVAGTVGSVEAVFLPDSTIKLESTALKETSGGDIAKAERVVCVGLGVKKQEDMQIVQDLASALDAEVGCTRSIAEERKWLSENTYIGITGALLKSKLYLSLGVSGQVQHTYGIRDVGCVVAIDKDAKAPIFREADYGVVGDLYEIVPALIEALKH